MIQRENLVKAIEYSYQLAAYRVPVNLVSGVINPSNQLPYQDQPLIGCGDLPYFDDTDLWRYNLPIADCDLGSWVVEVMLFGRSVTLVLWHAHHQKQGEMMVERVDQIQYNSDGCVEVVELQRRTFLTPVPEHYGIMVAQLRDVMSRHKILLVNGGQYREVKVA